MGYPIVRLPEPFDVVAYVRRVEQVLIDVCAELGLATTRVDGRSGVWVLADDKGPDRKVAAIGVRVARGVTMHGFALNCDCDLAWYDRIVACGIEDASVTSLSAELGRPVTVADALPVVERLLPALTDYASATSTTSPASEAVSHQHVELREARARLAMRDRAVVDRDQPLVRRRQLVAEHAVLVPDLGVDTKAVHPIGVEPLGQHLEGRAVQVRRHRLDLTGYEVADRAEPDVVTDLLPTEDRLRRHGVVLALDQQVVDPVPHLV